MNRTILKRIRRDTLCGVPGGRYGDSGNSSLRKRRALEELVGDSRNSSLRRRGWRGVVGHCARRVAGIAALVSIAVQGAVETSAPSSPADSIDRLAEEVGSQGWIVYGARSESGDWDLYQSRPDGRQRRPLTRTAEWSEFAPQISRDGRRMLYRRVTRGEQLDNNRHGEQGELVLANSDGSQPVALGRQGELPWASFSPGGEQVASLSIRGISFFSIQDRVVMGTLPRKGFFQQLTWSPDGDWLIGVANSYGAAWSIVRMNVLTGDAGAVNQVNCCTPDWFPDSHSVIFSWRPPGQNLNAGYGWTQLWRATADGTLRQLVYAEEGRHVYGGHVSPDGQYVLFTGNVQEDGDPEHAGAPMGLMRLSDAPIIRGKNTVLRAQFPAAAGGPILTLPSGWEPCWTSAEIAPHASILPGGEPHTGQQSKSTPTAQLADELHGHGWLVFSAMSEAGDWDLYLMRPDGQDRHRITATVEFNEGGARFSPDGRRLLYYRMPKADAPDNNTYGTFDLVLANANGSAPVILGNGFPWASWGPDGRQIACLTATGIRIVDVATRAVVREIPRRGIVSQLVWSPDGRYFTGTANNLGPYWNAACLNPDTGYIHAVSETERYNCTPDWMPDGRSILYARGIIPGQGGHAELWVGDASGKQRHPLYAESGRHIYGACASPDGRYLLFTRSAEDLGKVPVIAMAIIRWPGPDRTTPRDPEARLDLGSGWEPHWTSQEITP